MIRDRINETCACRPAGSRLTERTRKLSTSVGVKNFPAFFHSNPKWRIFRLKSAMVTEFTTRFVLSFCCYQISFMWFISIVAEKFKLAVQLQVNLCRQWRIVDQAGDKLSFLQGSAGFDQVDEAFDKQLSVIYLLINGAIFMYFIFKQVNIKEIWLHHMTCEK